MNKRKIDAYIVTIMSAIWIGVALLIYIALVAIIIWGIVMGELG